MVFIIRQCASTTLTLDDAGVNITRVGKTDSIRYTDVASMLYDKGSRSRSSYVTISLKPGYFINAGIKQPPFSNGNFYLNFFSPEQTKEFIPILTWHIQQVDGACLGPDFISETVYRAGINASD